MALDSYGWFADVKKWDSYKDIAASDWFQAGVKYVSENNLMSGVSDTGFAPNTAISHADTVLSLWHLAGEPSACCALPYENVESDAYRSFGLLRWTLSVRVEALVLTMTALSPVKSLPLCSISAPGLRRPRAH